MVRYTLNHGARPIAETLRRTRAVAAPDPGIDFRYCSGCADLPVTAKEQAWGEGSRVFVTAQRFCTPCAAKSTRRVRSRRKHARPPCSSDSFVGRASAHMA